MKSSYQFRIGASQMQHKSTGTSHCYNVIILSFLEGSSFLFFFIFTPTIHTTKLSLRSENDRQNINIYRGFIEKFSLFWDRREAPPPPRSQTRYCGFQDNKHPNVQEVVATKDFAVLEGCQDDLWNTLHKIIIIKK